VNAWQVAAVAVAVAACVFDIRASRIPNVLTFGAAAAALLFHAAAPGGQGAVFSLLGLVTGLAVFFPVFALGAMGAGDVKLMAALGAWLGLGTIVPVALYCALAGGVLALVVAMAHGYLRQALRNIASLFMFWRVAGVRPMPALTLEQGTGPRLPYALPIFVGLVVTLWRA
jgi:prepilin peptidase CpaA